jgi:ATP-dependent RNA circularization protein (DNA/RNA ligase family)
MQISTQPFLRKYFTDEEITKLQKKALRSDQFNDIVFVRLTSDYKNYQRGSIFYEMVS